MKKFKTLLFVVLAISFMGLVLVSCNPFDKGETIPTLPTFDEYYRIFVTQPDGDPDKTAAVAVEFPGVERFPSEGAVKIGDTGMAEIIGKYEPDLTTMIHFYSVLTGNLVETRSGMTWTTHGNVHEIHFVRYGNNQSLQNNLFRVLPVE